MDDVKAKPSGLLRPGTLSKLPMPRSSRPAESAPLQTQLQPPAPPAAPTVSKPAKPTPTLLKRSSIAALPRSSAPSAIKPPPLASKPLARSGLAAGTKNISKSAAATTTTTSSSRSSSNPRLKPQNRQPRSLSRPGENEENADCLATRDRRRFAPSQGSRVALHDGAPPDQLDNVEFPEMNEENAISPSRDTASLSDRTIESLQSVPTTPKDRRRSSFFNPVESPMAPPLPSLGPSMSRERSNSSRSGTSNSDLAKPPSRSSSPAKRPSAGIPTPSRLPSFGSTPTNRRSVSAGLTSKLRKAQTPSTQRTSSPAKPPATNASTGLSNIGSGNKLTTSTKPAKPRPILGEAFVTPKKTAPANNAVDDSMTAEPKRAVSNSSIALRQQIAAAKAAARKGKATKHDSPQDMAAVVDTVKFDHEMHADPFNQAPRDDKHILRNRINAARVDGKLNIAAMSLKQIPGEVRKMYSSAAMEESKVNWAEVVDLTKLIAADNEFEELDDDLFPDQSPEDLELDDQTEGNQFGGLETLDLHGNLLQAIPLGFRRLERLTRLDIAHNKLENTAFDIVAQIKSLRELKLGHNNLNGSVPTSLCELFQLETLDLQANRLLGLPEALRELVSLRVLNVSGNQLTTLPMDALQQLPLAELDVSGNALIASLFPLGGPNGHPTLQVLNVANNSLAALTFMEPLLLPQLKSLNITNNHMTALPAVTGWTELLTLLAGDNKVTELPQGFTTLQKLRNVNFTSNELRIIDPEIARMPSLESLILAANPLRERKFLTMSAADIKRDLRLRLEPRPEDNASDLDEPTSPVTVIAHDDYDEPPSTWSLKAQGVLDLVAKGLSDDLNDLLGPFLASHEAKKVELQSNRITCIPPALCMGQYLRVLDLSDNMFSADYLSEELELPSLQELSISKCRLTSLEPLTTRMVAPNLQILNLSTNRLSGILPSLKRTYPVLTTLFANDNKFTSISAESLRGMQTVNLESNDIEQLPAEIGLLWDEGLRSFAIARNAFRVPNYRILDKGTETTLRWLRDRLPASADASAGIDELN